MKKNSLLKNTNTFQLALFSTSNGTFANFIYSNIGWTQGAEAGFNAGDGNNFFALPTSGTGNIMYLEDYGNTGKGFINEIVSGKNRMNKKYQKLNTSIFPEVYKYIYGI